MRANVENSILHVNVNNVDNNLTNIEKTLKDMIKISIEEIEKHPIKEKELITLWANHANNLSDFFFQQCQQTGNKDLYKNIVKYMMFNR
jgi:hypothetical protein